MKIIIPMSGVGKRFKDVSYVLPKPLIVVNGKPIIQHVVEMFPGDHSFIFICNKNHLDATHMKDVLLLLVPSALIIPVDTHSQGPVYATSLAYPYIKDEDEVMVSYCDYGMEFDFDGMCKQIYEGLYDGAVPSYTGFHPHLLHKNLYGGILTDGKGRILEYKEKYSFTEDPMQSHHSVGAYYFRNGKEFKQYGEELSNSAISINGEKYTSMVYYLYLRDGKKIFAPEVTKFMQWGTPTDLEEFESWSRYFAKELDKEKGETSIPKERENLVKVPYEEGTENFKKSYTYWKDYFKKQ
jgi:NDP-sugar pyrophosphorylase family protein